MKLKYLLFVIAGQLVVRTTSQNAKSYDTDDWIPVTQNAAGEETAQKRATARVLNLDMPSQKFFPDEFVYKKGRPDYQSRPKHKDRHNVPKYENTYKFEVPPTLPQTGQGKFQYFPNQEIQLPNYQQPPSLDIYRSPSTQRYVQTVVSDRLPPPNIQNSYDQYGSPTNNTNLYQAVDPVSINQELLSNIRFQNIGSAGYQDSKIFYQNSDGALAAQINGRDGAQNQNFFQNINTPNKQPLIADNNGVTTEKADGGKEAVQLVYVPLENLKQNQPLPQDSQTIYRQSQSPRYENPIDKGQRLASIEQDFIQQALQSSKLQEQIQQGDPLLYRVSTTPKSIRKRKPHQPPLAVYVEGEKHRVDVEDVLDALKRAQSIAVQDSVRPDSPQIFIGPSTLDAPDHSKFPLPYLNSIDGNRIHGNIDSLPFFVAPLTFKTPPGFSKIPLPAPHVGSVVVSNGEQPYNTKITVKPSELGNSLHSTTPKPAVDTITTQPYVEQTYYSSNTPAVFSSPEPQLLRFTPNENKEYTFSDSVFNQQTLDNKYVEQNPNDQSIRSQSTNENPSDGNISTNSAFQYSYIDEVATRTTPRNTQNTPENARYNVQTNSYDLPRVTYYPDEEAKTFVSSYQQQRHGTVQKSNDAVVQYEPIATTFDRNPRPPQQEEVVNIKPKAEHVTNTASRQKTNIYANDNTQKPHLPEVNPLELAINEFELHQINSQLEEKPRIKNQNVYKARVPLQETHNDDYRFDPELHRFSSTPTSILRDSYESTTRPATKARGRVRTRPTTTTTAAPEDEPYTVLEDFVAREKPTSQYSRPSSIQYTPETVQTERNPSQKIKYPDTVTEIENIPTNVYSLNNDPDTGDHSYTLNQHLMDAQILQSDVKQIPPAYEQQGQFEVDLRVKDYAIPTNRNNNPRQPQPVVQYTEETSSNQSEYVDPLEDPSVRSLLVPSLLVPTTTKNSVYTGPSYLPTTEKIVSSTTTTTVRPTATATETTIHSRTRSRTRGGSRFSETNTTRRPAPKRRPTQYSRVTERARQTPETEYSTRSSISKQRFRTRGRTTPNYISERSSTTENEIHEGPTSDATLNIRTHPDGSESYIQYDQTIDQKVQEPVRNEDYPSVHVTSIRPFLQYENTASTPKPVLNVQVTHPVETYQKYEEEEPSKFRIRGRVKDRVRASSTTTEKVVTQKLTTPKPVVNEEADEEFYGFFKQPNFGPPPVAKVEITTSTPPKIFNYQTLSQHREDYQLPVDNVNIDTSTVRFIGEIVPKYTTSREIQTETPRPRIRGRTRIAQRKPVASREYIEQTTKRQTAIRSRGKTHYRLPENLKKNKDEEADIEGGNYPPQYFTGRKETTTPTVGFQITVAPDDDDDQAPHSSIHRPNIVASPEEWHDALDHISERKSNKLENNEEPSTLLKDPASPIQPYALPSKLATDDTSTDSSEEKFRKTTQQIEEQFEAINNFNQPPAEKSDGKKKTRKKGVWKLVKQRPLDRLETSESQNYLSVLNSFHDIQKVDAASENEHYRIPFDSYSDEKREQEATTENYRIEEVGSTENTNAEIMTKDIDDEQSTKRSDAFNITTIPSVVLTQYPKQEEDFLDSIYEMFGMSREQLQEESSTLVTEVTETTTVPNPTFPEELTDSPISHSTVNATETPTETATLQELLTTAQTEARFEVGPWDMKEVRTSTSTEISHETEICYRGRCVRSSEKKKRV